MSAPRCLPSDFYRPRFVLLALRGGVEHALRLPLCQRCGRTVDTLRAQDLPGAHVHLAAFCHGRIEQLRVPRAELLGPGTHVHLGPVFGRRIPGRHPRLPFGAS